MAVSAKGKFPNHLGLLWKGAGNLARYGPLAKNVFFADRDTTEKTIFTDWLFGQTGAPSYFGILKRWAGAAWVKEPLKVYLGSWQSKPLKRWNGTEWKLVDTTGV